MSDEMRRQPSQPGDLLKPVPKAGSASASWTDLLVLFLRIMAAVSLVKGLYHWGQVCGIGAAPGHGFEAHTLAWQSTTAFFAVIDLVAAVGLWLTAPWGAVVWLTSVVSMAVEEVFFPSVYGGNIVIVAIEIALLGVYLWLAVVSARERPE